MLSMVPVKPMVPKVPTPPVQKIEILATFELSAPPSPTQPKACQSVKNAKWELSEGTQIYHAELTVLAACPKSEHGLGAGAARAAWICTQLHIAAQGRVNLAAAGWRLRAERGGAHASDIPSRWRWRT